MVKKRKTPKSKRHGYKRKDRLQQGSAWLRNYEGKNIILGYRRWYGVDEICAIIELRLLGISIEEEILEEARVLEKKRVKRNIIAKQKKEEQLLVELHEDSDENFFFIAGYTSNGVPYGVTWDEVDEDFI